MTALKQKFDLLLLRFKKSMKIKILLLFLPLLQGSEHPDFHEYMKELFDNDYKWVSFLTELQRQGDVCPKSRQQVIFKNYVFRFADKFDELYQKIKDSKQGNGELTEFLGQVLTTESWFAILHDIDILEKECSAGFMGSYHVDVPNLAGLPPLSPEEANFYLQKAKLYQGYGKDGWKGPFSTFMPNYMKTKNWLKFFLHFEDQKFYCFYALQNSGVKEPNITMGYLPEATDSIKNFQRDVTRLIGNVVNRDIPNGRPLSEELENYVNTPLTDHKWAQIINEVAKMESLCTEKLLGKNFVHFSWPFIAGVSKDPLLSYQMSKMIANLLEDLYESLQ